MPPKCQTVTQNKRKLTFVYRHPCFKETAPLTSCAPLVQDRDVGLQGGGVCRPPLVGLGDSVHVGLLPGHLLHEGLKESSDPNQIQACQ